MNEKTPVMGGGQALELFQKHLLSVCVLTLTDDLLK